jgi:hypothetical protein
VNIEEALTAYIKASSVITAIIGSGNDTRFWFDEPPASKPMPYIIAQNISNVLDHTHNGQAKSERPKYQLTAFASTRAGARALAESIKAVFCDFKGVMSGLVIQYITLINELPDTLTSADGTIKLHAVALEFEIVYNKE